MRFWCWTLEMIEYIEKFIYPLFVSVAVIYINNRLYKKRKIPEIEVRRYHRSRHDYINIDEFTIYKFIVDENGSMQFNEIEAKSIADNSFIFSIVSKGTQNCKLTNIVYKDEVFNIDEKIVPTTRLTEESYLLVFEDSISGNFISLHCLVENKKYEYKMNDENDNYIKGRQIK